MKRGIENPLVYCIILSYNSVEWLETCLDSLLKTSYTNYKILVIDNNSSDGSVAILKKYLAKIEIIENDKNAGWCEANNIAIKYSEKKGAEYVMLLNSDTKVTDQDWLTKIVIAAQENLDYAVLGCIQYQYNDCREINNWTKYILYHGDRDYMFMWDRNSDIEAGIHYYQETDLEERSILDCYFVQGAAMLIKTELFKHVGYFCDKLYMFYDEVEFCRRVHTLGNKVGLVANSHIQHYGGAISCKDSKAQKNRNFWYSRNKYIMLLSDVNRSFKDKLYIAKRLLTADIKDAVTKKADVSSIWQLIHIFLSLGANFKVIYDIRNKTKRLLPLETVENN